MISFKRNSTESFTSGKTKSVSCSKCGVYSVLFCKSANGEITYQSSLFRCKSWDCPHCSKVKARKIAKRMERLFDGRSLWLYTLTFKHHLSSELTFKLAAKCFNRLFTNLRRKYGRFSYVRILETHKKSCFPHYHIIVDRCFVGSNFATLARNAGFGWQIDVRPITSNGAGGYIRKYLSKPWPREDARAIRYKLKLRLATWSRNMRVQQQPKEDTKWLGICQNKQEGYNKVIKDLAFTKRLLCPQLYQKSAPKLFTIVFAENPAYCPASLQGKQEQYAYYNPSENAFHCEGDFISLFNS